MSGETDLAVLLHSLNPRLDDTDYAFATLPFDQAVPVAIDPIGTFREAEGLTLIAPSAQLVGTNIAHSAGWAMLTMEVHSALDAIGMMAAIARALANVGISVNAVAGFHHDHVFVQWDRRHDAVAALRALATNPSV